jgi:hypothetical protein
VGQTIPNNTVVFSLPTLPMPKVLGEGEVLERFMQRFTGFPIPPILPILNLIKYL